MTDIDRPVRLSVIVPVGGTTVGLEEMIGSYGAGIETFGDPFEVLLVTSGPSWPTCSKIAETRGWARPVAAAQPRWGSAVRAGMSESNGEILCYLNWERTPVAALTEMMSYARDSPELVLRANRRTRDTFRQRVGSLLFNLECRALLGTTAWDVNGTPKIFSRTRTKLLELKRDDDLIDAEFALVCEREGYSVAEIPISADPTTGDVTPVRYRAALRMYAGVPGLR